MTKPKSMLFSRKASVYREEATIEASAYLLSQLTGPGEPVPYIQLIKLLYLADREQLKRRGTTISGDTHWSLELGPILSDTLNAIKSRDERWLDSMGIDLEARVIWLTASPARAKLSRADVEVLDDVLKQFGHLPWQDLVEYTHELPVWVKPKQGGRKRIYIADIARAVGVSAERIKMIVDSQEESGEVRRFVASLQGRKRA